MARKRTKSHSDIAAQADRLEESLKEQALAASRKGDAEGWGQSLARLARVKSASSRYLANIEKRKAYRAEEGRLQALWDSGDLGGLMRAADARNARQWSQAAYMGLGNG